MLVLPTAIFFALAPLRSVPQAGSQFRGFATAIHEMSGLVRNNKSQAFLQVKNKQPHGFTVVTTN
ncbi:MAG: hypothetical protein DRG34_03385 [Deltaproteobacteria bacterium]|nr:MAG: hypothetical protein DRG34_03385 [Deltaproteobacteria bacterium]